MFVVKAFFFANSISCTNQVFYYYRNNETSTTRSRKYTKEVDKARVLVIIEIYDFFNKNISSKYKYLLRRFIKKNVFKISIMLRKEAFRKLLSIDGFLVLQSLKKPFKYFIFILFIIFINIFNPLQIRLFVNILFAIFIALRVKNKR